MQRSCADVNSPYKRKCWTNGGPLFNSLLWELYLQEEMSAAIKAKAQARSRTRAAKKSDDKRQGS
jgi:hypothetical protein